MSSLNTAFKTVMSPTRRRSSIGSAFEVLDGGGFVSETTFGYDEGDSITEPESEEEEELEDKEESVDLESSITIRRRAARRREAD